MTGNEEKIIWELRVWQQQMQRPPTFINELATKMQRKLNSLIPEKAHRIITTTLKQMIRGVLFGAKITTRKTGLSLPPVI
jgi:hypothetical protein